MTYSRPPRLAEWLIATRVWPDDRAFVLGDADEQFQDRVRTEGELRGAWWYWRYAIALAWGMWWWRPRPAWSKGGVMAMDDVRYAVRRLRKQPLASLVSIATLACAIGAAAATWSLISSVMLHPLHVKEPERLVAVGFRRNATSPPSSGFNYPNSRILLATRLMPLAAWGSIGSNTPLLVETNGEPRVRSVRFASPEFLDVIGLKPTLGRFITAEEDQPGAPLVAVLSERFWKSEFKSDASVIGRTIRVRNHPTRIVGVAPRNFRGLRVGGAPDLFMPLHSIDRVEPYTGLFSERPPVSWIELVGRLPDGATQPEMEGRLNSLQLQLLGGGYTPETTLTLTDVETAALSDGTRTDLKKFARLLGSTVGLLLAIGSLTVGMLLLMRTEARGGEFALSLALGASRARLATGVAIEGAILAAAGTLLALPVSRLMFAGIRVFRLPGQIRIGILDLSLDGRVLAGAAGAAAVSVLLIAGIASLFALKRDHGDVLRSQSGATPRVTRRSSRAALVTAQVAVTLVLVTGAGLFARSVSRGLSLNPDFDTSRVLFGELPDLRAHGYDGPRSKVFADEFRTRLLQQPTVTSVSLSESNQSIGLITVDGLERKLKSVSLVGIDTQYMATIGLPVLAGRGFTAEDAAGSSRVAIINASLARAIAGDGSALGRRIGPPSDPRARWFTEAQVVGVVPDIKAPGSLNPHVLYMPSTQYSAPVYEGSGGLSLAVRASGDAEPAAAAVASTIRAIDPAIYPTPPKTLDAQILDGFGPQRFGMTVMGALGSIALLLSVLGTYVIAESMAVLRRREMGIRAALGASGGQLGSLLLSDTFRLVGAGLVLGFGLAWLGSATIRSFLFQVEPFDPLVTGGVATIIIVLALAVSLRPALAAARIDLARVLRQD